MHSKGPTMLPFKNASVVCFAALLSIICITSATGFCDTIYLKNGKILRDIRITSEDETSILIENQDEWKRINKSDVDMIKKAVKNAPTPQENENSLQDKSIQEQPQEERQVEIKPNGMRIKGRTDEGSISLGINLLGRNTVTGLLDDSGYGIYSLSTSYDIENGVALIAEYVGYTEEVIGVGLGAEYQLPRKIKNNSGTFNFIPVYGILKVRSVPDTNGSYTYLVGHLGINVFNGDNDFKGVGGALTNGLYYGVGFGFEANNIVQVNLLYSWNTGKFTQKFSYYAYDYSYTLHKYVYTYHYAEASGDIEYANLGITFGIAF